MLTDVGDVPVQELRDCGVDDDRLMNIISESVKLVMEQVSHALFLFSSFYHFFNVRDVLHTRELREFNSKYVVS